jgi:hypothetical protein
MYSGECIPDTSHGGSPRYTRFSTELTMKIASSTPPKDQPQYGETWGMTEVGAGISEGFMEAELP